MRAQSDIGRLLRVAMKHPRDAFISQTSIDSQWTALNFLAAPDFHGACREFDALLRLLEDHSVQVDLLPADPLTGLDSIYTRDASLATEHGLVLLSMGKALRRGEPTAQGVSLAAAGFPVLGAMTSPGTAEGGDMTWLDSRTLAIGHGYRTNAQGIEQLRTLLAGVIDDLVVVPLPHWRGVNDVMHLMSLFSPVDSSVALVYSPLLPVAFRSLLLDRGLRLVEVPDDEFDSMAANVLAIAPGTVVALRGNRRTREALEHAGIEVLEYDGLEISVKGAGGPTCLTRPLLRLP